MQSSLNDYSISILKMNSHLKLTLNTKGNGRWEKRCTLENFLVHTKNKKNGVPLPRCLHHQQNGRFQNSLSVAAITKIFLQCSIFSETTPCLLFQSSFGFPTICSLCFGFPCHFATLNLIFIVACEQIFICQILHTWCLHEAFNCTVWL